MTANKNIGVNIAWWDGKGIKYSASNQAKIKRWTDAIQTSLYWIETSHKIIHQTLGYIIISKTYKNPFIKEEVEKDG